MYRRSPRVPDDDEISLISMRELAPTPIEDYDSYLDADPGRIHLTEEHSGDADPAGSTPSLPPPSSRGLSFWLTRTQRYSSYAFTSFLGLHATTVSLTPLLLGVDTANSTLLLARTYFYHSHPYVESLLVPGSLLLHISSGLALRLHRHYTQRQRHGGRPPAAVSQWRLRNFSGASRAGWAMVPFVAAHAALMRAVPLLADGGSSDVGLQYLGHGFAMGRGWWWTGVGFYGAMVGLVSYHVVFGWAKYLGVGRRRRGVTAAAAMGVAAAWLSGLAVVVRAGPARGYLGRHYDHLYNVFLLRAV